MAEKPIAVVAALVGNLIIALAKLSAGIIANSAAMLAEAAHSFSDVGNQVLLLIGVVRSKQPVSERFPFGTERSQYFWSFMVAVLLFGVAGVYSMLEGIEKWRHPHPIGDIRLSLAILAGAFIIEAVVLTIAVRQAKRRARAAGVGTVRGFIESNRDATLLTVIVEDTLALIGLPVAAAAIALSAWTGDPRFDAAGSIIIGALLMGFALFLGNQTRELLIGRGLGKPEAQRIREALLAHPRVTEVRSLQTMHLGADAVLLGADVAFSDLSAVTTDLEELEAKIRKAVPAVRYVFLEPQG